MDGNKMRLTCPNCEAQYEVPTELVPLAGRDVQCSNCSTTWFQAHPDQIEETTEPALDLPPEPAEIEQDPHLTEDVPEVEEELPPPPPPRPEAAKRRAIDPSVQDVLRQEAEHEAHQRASENTGGLESQPDLGLDTTPIEPEPERRAREGRERMARMRGEPMPAAAAVAATTAAAGSRRALLPDIEEINSTLTSTSERRPAEAADADLKTDPRRGQPKKRKGGRRGFATVILLAAIAIAAYVFGPKIAEMVPAAGPMIEQYTALVEQARGWLSTSLDKALAWLDQMASENLGTGT